MVNGDQCLAAGHGRSSQLTFERRQNAARCLLKLRTTGEHAQLQQRRGQHTVAGRSRSVLTVFDAGNRSGLSFRRVKERSRISVAEVFENDVGQFNGLPQANFVEGRLVQFDQTVDQTRVVVKKRRDG